MKPQKPKLKITLAASAVLHLVFIFLISIVQPPPDFKPKILEISFKPSEPNSEAPRATGRVRTAVRTKAVKNISLSRLTPRLSLEPPRKIEAESDDEVSQLSSWADARAYLGMSANSAGGLTHQQFNFIKSLWQAIDNQIADNPFLSEYNHTGQVFVRFELDAEGNLAPKSLHASAHDGVLKVLSLRAIRAGIKGVPNDAQFTHRWTLVNASFSWSSYEKCASARGSHGEYLSFCHYAENKRKKFTNGERLAHHAAAIYNNGPWAAEEIRKYNREERHREEDFDPFEDLKRDPDWSL